MYIINEEIEDVLEDGSVADRIIKQIHNLKPDTEIREHSAYIMPDCKLKEKGFCECQENGEHECNDGTDGAGNVDADGTCLVCGKTGLI